MPPISSSFPTLFFFFFNDTATTEIYTLSLHDALPIFCTRANAAIPRCAPRSAQQPAHHRADRSEEHTSELQSHSDLVCRLLLEKKVRRQLGREYRNWSDAVFLPAVEAVLQHAVLRVDPLSHPANDLLVFFFNDTATTEIYPLSLHDALPIFRGADVLIRRVEQASDRHFDVFAV